MPNEVKTLVIDNFGGRLTRENFGSINSGLAKYSSTFGNDPFTNPSNLTWLSDAINFQTNVSGVDFPLLVTAKTRLENGITYLYMLGGNGGLYKVQINDPFANPPLSYIGTTNLLTTLSQIFQFGTSMQFYQNKIFVGGDSGVTKVNFDGTGETFISASWTTSVPRPSVQFLGKLYFGNGANIAEIDSTETVTNVNKLSPGFPSGTYVRDLDITPDGTYLQAIVSSLIAPYQTSTTQDTNSLSSADSYKFLWNGTDLGYTSFEIFNSYSITSNITFGPFSYTVGNDLGGAALYSNSTKVVTLPFAYSPSFGAMFSLGNLVGFATPEYDTENQRMTMSIFLYGQYDEQTASGLYRLYKYNGITGQVSNEVTVVPLAIIITDLYYSTNYGNAGNPYANNQSGIPIAIFSINGNQSNGLSAWNSFRFGLQGNPAINNTAIQGTYETQNQMFSKKITVKEVRVYGDPWDSNVNFNIQLIGSNGTMHTQTFTQGTNLTSGADFAWYTPPMSPTYTLGVQINNTSNINFTINKIEVDYTIGGK